MENTNDTHNVKRSFSLWIGEMREFLRGRFSLDEDKAQRDEVVAAISKGVVFRGVNLWVLIFATMIASLGLNVNSAAVIIGAMLISPIMGPIMGIGLSLGINDFELLKKALRNYALMFIVAIITSTVYFLVSPLSSNSSELLARTVPTTYDVLIALFGGLAGIVAQTRQDRTSTVIPGVAIATVISQMISCVLVLRCLCRSESSYRLRFSELGMKGYYLKQIFSVGVPAGIQSTVINFSNVLLQSSVNSFGSTAMAGYTAANNLLGFLYVSVNSITQACMSFTSQNYGVGKLKRMDRVLADCMILSVVVAVVLGCICYGFGPEILQIYTEDAEVIACGMEILAYTTITYFLCGWMDLFPGALRGMGYSAVPMVLSVIGTVGTRVVWIFGIFPYHRSLAILFISYPASWIITIVLQVICFYFVRRRVHRRSQALAGQEG